MQIAMKLHDAMQDRRRGVPCRSRSLRSLLAMAAPALAFTAYVSNEKGNSISIIDTDKMEVTKTVQVGHRPRGIALNKDGSELYICAGDDDRIEILDTKKLAIVGTLPSGPDPELLILSPDGKLLYVANENDNLVTAIDVATRKIVAEIPVGVEPEGHGAEPRRQSARQYVGNDEYGASDRHANAQDCRQCPRRCEAARRPISRRTVRNYGSRPRSAAR